MSLSGVEIRPVEERDQEGLAALATRSSDGGAVAFAPRARLPVLEAMRLRRPNSAGFVAVVPEGRVVGVGWVSYDLAGHPASSSSEGRISTAWLHSLAVDPDWRRRGIARALTDARLEDAAARPDPGVVLAAIQVGNEPSWHNANRWCNQILGTIRVTPVPPPRQFLVSDSGRTTSEESDVVVRPVRNDDLEQVSGGLRRFARGHLFAPVPEPDELAAWLAQRVHHEPLNEYAVACTADGRVVGGLGMQNESRLGTLEVTHLPRTIALANVALRVVPPDRQMRNLNVRLPWFDPGHEVVTRTLWQSVRRSWRGLGSSLVLEVDPKGPVAQALRIPRWLPSTTLRIVARQPGGLDLPQLPLGFTP